jgi:hypothetical protein
MSEAGIVRIPFYTEPKPDGALYACFRPQVVVRLNHFEVGADIYKLHQPVTITPGMNGRFEIDRKSLRGKEPDHCDVVAIVETLSGDDDMLERPDARVPHGPLMGTIETERQPAPFVIQPKQINVLMWNVGEYTAGGLAEFRHLDLNFDRGLETLYLTDLRIGVRTQIISEKPIPMRIAIRKGTFGTDLIAPGCLLAVTIENRGEEPVTITGDVVVERIARKATPLGKFGPPVVPMTPFYPHPPKGRW